MRSAFVFGCFCLVLVAMVKSQTCQLNLDCQDHFGPVPAPTENSVMRGKMGPKGSKGEVGLKGEVGPKGPDNSHLVSKNEKSILEVREQVGRTESVARQNSQQISEILEIVSRLDTKFKDILLKNSKNEAFVQNGTARRNVKQEVKSRFLNNSKNEAFVQNKVSRNAKQEVPARGAQGTNETQDTQEPRKEVSEKGARGTGETQRARGPHEGCEVAGVPNSSHGEPFTLRHNETVEVRCDVRCTMEGEGRRKCLRGKVQPGFDSHPLTCTPKNCQVRGVPNSSKKTQFEVEHNSNTTLECDFLYMVIGESRVCKRGMLYPDPGNPLRCQRAQMNWTSAREHCRNHGKDLIMDRVDTPEQRREMCEKYGNFGYVWIGYKMAGGDSAWKRVDGKENSAEFVWGSHRGYFGNEDVNYMYVNCYRFDRYYTDVFNGVPQGVRHFGCQDVN